MHTYKLTSNKCCSGFCFNFSWDPNWPNPAPSKPGIPEEKLTSGTLRYWFNVLDCWVWRKGEPDLFLNFLYLWEMLMINGSWIKTKIRHIEGTDIYLFIYELFKFVQLIESKGLLGLGLVCTWATHQTAFPSRQGSSFEWRCFRGSALGWRWSYLEREFISLLIIQSHQIEMGVHSRTQYYFK